jgi:phosphatidylglycerophosphatase A
MIYHSRRKIIWKNIREFKSVVAVVLATALGAGLLPFAPGTMGSVAGMPLAYAFRNWPVGPRLLFWSLIFLVGIWAAAVFDRLMETQDNQNIVIDEVVGIGIATWTAGDPATWVAAFVLFRFFDICKFPPVRSVDQWSKKQSSSGWSGFGVMADDVIAGFEALLCILVMQSLGVLT